MNKREFLDAVLSEVNALRAAAGLEPLNELPKGVPSLADTCPLARAFGEEVDTDGTGCGLGVFIGTEWVPSSLLAEFVARFDAREYPELVEQESA